MGSKCFENINWEIQERFCNGNDSNHTNDNHSLAALPGPGIIVQSHLILATTQLVGMTNLLLQTMKVKHIRTCPSSHNR